MQKTPLISVIIPCYNVEVYVEECIESVISQSYCNIEIVIVNDGSTDGTEEKIIPFLEKDNRIKYFFQENKGLSEARNKGLDEMKGEYVCLIDSDDFIHKDYIKILYDNLVKYEADISMCDFSAYYEGKSDEFHWDILSYETFINNREECLYEINKNGTYVVAWNKLYKSEIFDDLRYIPQKVHEDEFIIHHIYWKVIKVVYTKDKLYAYRQRPSSIMGATYTNAKLKNAIEAFEDRQKFFIQNNIPYIDSLINIKWHVIYTRGILESKFEEAQRYIVKNHKEFFRDDVLLDIPRRKKRKIYLKALLSQIKKLFHLK